MKPNISEFSYGYTLTDELIHWHGIQLTAAPVFPSLYQEGQTGGGYDVMLQRPGLPLFLQFKLSDCLVNRSAKEAGILSIPYYRMHIRPARHSEQHEMLLDLESAGNDVYYCAPAFHKPQELDQAYLHRQVRSRSLWIKPSVIGPLPDGKDHYVAFQVPGGHLFRSKPRFLETKGDFEEFTKSVEDSFRQKGRAATSKEALDRLADTIKKIASKRRDISLEAKQLSESELAKRHPLDRIAFYSHIFMDCQFFIVREKNAPKVPMP